VSEEGRKKAWRERWVGETVYVSGGPLKIQAGGSHDERSERQKKKGTGEMKCNVVTGMVVGAEVLCLHESNGINTEKGGELRGEETAEART